MTGPREAGAWLADPGEVPVGATFRTALYLRAGAPEAAGQALVEIVFDPHMMFCAALEPPPANGASVSHDVTIAVGRVTARITVRDAGPADGRGPGIAVATVKWRCAAEGASRIDTRLLLPELCPPAALLVVQRPRA